MRWIQAETIRMIYTFYCFLPNLFLFLAHLFQHNISIITFCIYMYMYTSIYTFVRFPFDIQQKRILEEIHCVLFQYVLFLHLLLLYFCKKKRLTIHLYIHKTWKNTDIQQNSIMDTRIWDNIITHPCLMLKNVLVHTTVFSVIIFEFL